MSRITDELDASTEHAAAAPGRVAVASAEVGTTTRAAAELAAGGSALGVVLSALEGAFARDAREVRMVAFDRVNGARAYAGPRAGLSAGEPAWARAVEGGFRGHEVFLAPGPSAEPMALALALLGELAPAAEDDEAEGLAAAVAVARRAVRDHAGAFEALLEPDSLDALLDVLDREPAAPPLAAAPGETVCIVAIDADGSLCAATAGDAPETPLVALRFGGAFLGVAGPSGPEGLLAPLVRYVDRAAPADALLDDAEAFGPGELVLVVRDDTGALDARTDARGAGAAAVQDALGSTSSQA